MFNAGLPLDRNRSDKGDRRDPWRRGARFYRDLCDYVGFDAESEQDLVDSKTVVEPHFDAVVDVFYDALWRNPHTRNLFDDEAQVDRLRVSLRRWLDELFTGPHDHAYFERRWDIGRRHVEVGLLPHFMFGAMNVVRREIYRLASGELVAKQWASIERALDLDLMIMVQSYWDLLTRERTRRPAALASGVAHEIRNPLNGISLNLTLLERTLSAEDKAQVGSIIDSIRGELGRIQGLTTEMIDYARPIELRPTRFQLKPFVDEFTRFHKPAIDAYGVAFDSVVDDSADAIFADRDKLRQMLINLVSNATDAVSSDGGCVTLRFSDDGTGVLVEVTDNGDGMQTSQLYEIFDLFYTTKATGTGLGLPIVKNIIEAHYGTVDVRSKPGQGTTVQLYFPHPHEG